MHTRCVVDITYASPMRLPHHEWDDPAVYAISSQLYYDVLSQNSAFFVTHALYYLLLYQPETVCRVPDYNQRSVDV